MTYYRRFTESVLLYIKRKLKKGTKMITELVEELNKEAEKAKTGVSPNAGQVSSQ